MDNQYRYQEDDWDKLADGRIIPFTRIADIPFEWDAPPWVRTYHADAYMSAVLASLELKVPNRYIPMPEDGVLRVIDYPPGCGCDESVDMGLFTLELWRSHPGDFSLTDGPIQSGTNRYQLHRARARWPNLLVGGLGAEVGLGAPTEYSVQARPYHQKALVYMAFPSMNARLAQPCGWAGGHGTRHGHGCGCQVTVGEWLDEIMKRVTT